MVVACCQQYPSHSTEDETLRTDLFRAPHTAPTRSLCCRCLGETFVLLRSKQSSANEATNDAERRTEKASAVLYKLLPTSLRQLGPRDMDVNRDRRDAPIPFKAPSGTPRLPEDRPPCHSAPYDRARGIRHRHFLCPRTRGAPCDIEEDVREERFARVRGRRARVGSPGVVFFGGEEI